jgi:hypothetical protein
MSIWEFLEIIAGGDWSLDAAGNLMDGNDDCPLHSAGYECSADEPDDGRRSG